MKKLAVVGIMACVCMSFADDIVSQVRSSMSSVISALPAGRRGTPEYIREFGIPLKRYPAYQPVFGCSRQQ